MNTLTRDEFTSAISQLADSVYDFNHRFGVPIRDPATVPDESLTALRGRLSFLMEEIGEHSKGLNTGNLEEAILELADVAFVLLGTILITDADGSKACLTVSTKNDLKTTETHVFEKSSGKLIKRHTGK